MASSWDQIASVLGREEKRRAEIKREIVSNYICVYVYVYMCTCVKDVSCLWSFGADQKSLEKAKRKFTLILVAAYFILFFFELYTCNNLARYCAV